MYIGPKVYSIWAHGPLGFRVRGGEAVKLVSAVMFSCGVGPSSSKENSLRHSQARHRERRFVDPAMRPLAQGPTCPCAKQRQKARRTRTPSRSSAGGGLPASAPAQSSQVPCPFLSQALGPDGHAQCNSVEPRVRTADKYGCLGFM